MAEATSQPTTVPTVEEPAIANTDQQQTAVASNKVDPIVDPKHATRDLRFAPGARQAFFSTELGAQAPRSLGPLLAPPIVRSVNGPAAVVQAARYWQTKYKNQCLCILPNQGWVVEDLWDFVDLHIEGRKFCEQMLDFIAHDTWYAADKFAKDWAQVHPERFDFTGINIGNVYDLNDPLTVVDQIFAFGESVSFPRTFLWHVAFMLICNWNEFNRVNNVALEVRKGRKLPVVAEQDTKEAAESPIMTSASDVKKMASSFSGDLARSAVTAFTSPNQPKPQPHIQHIVPHMPQQPGDQLHTRNNGLEPMVGPPTASPNTRGKVSNRSRGNRSMESGSHSQKKGRAENEGRVVSGPFLRQKPAPMTGMQPQYIPTHMPMSPHMAAPMVPSSAIGSYVLGPPMVPQPGCPIQSVDAAIASRVHMSYQPDVARTLQMPPPYINQPRVPHAMLMGDMTNMHFSGQMSSQVVDPRAPLPRRVNYSNNNQLFDPYGGTNRKFSGVQDYSDSTKKGPGSFLASQSRGRKMSTSDGRPAYNSYNAMSSTASHYTDFSTRRRLSEDDPKITGDSVSGCGHTWIGPNNSTVNELWIGDLPHDVCESELLKMFEEMVKITPVTISLRNNVAKGPFHAFVTFESISDTKAALKINQLNPRLRNGDVQPTVSVPRRFFQKESASTTFFDLSRTSQMADSNTHGATNTPHKEKKPAADANKTTDMTGGMVVYSPQDARSGLPRKPSGQLEAVSHSEAGSPGPEKSKRHQKSPTKKGKGKYRRDSPAKRDTSADDEVTPDGKLKADTLLTASIEDVKTSVAADTNADNIPPAEVKIESTTNTTRDVGHTPDDGPVLDTQSHEQTVQSQNAQNKEEILVMALPELEPVDLEACREKAPSPAAQDVSTTTLAAKADKETDEKRPQPLVEEALPLTTEDQTSDDEAKNDNSFHSAPEVQPDAAQVETETEVRDQGVSANQGTPKSPVVTEEPNSNTAQASNAQPEQPMPASPDVEGKPEASKPEEYSQQDKPVAAATSHEEADSATKGEMMPTSGELSPVDTIKKGGAQQMQSLHPFATKNKAQAKKEREIKRKQQKKEEADRIAKAKADKASKATSSKKAKRDGEIEQKDEISASPSPSTIPADASTGRDISKQNIEERNHGRKMSKGKSGTQTVSPYTEENQKKKNGGKEMNQAARHASEALSVVQAVGKAETSKISGGKRNPNSLLSGPTSIAARGGTLSDNRPNQEANNLHDDSSVPVAHKPEHEAGWLMVSNEPLPTVTTLVASRSNSPQHTNELSCGSLSRNSSISTLAAEAPGGSPNTSAPVETTDIAGNSKCTYTGSTAVNSDNAPVDTPKKKTKKKGKKKKKAPVAEPSNPTQSDVEAKTPKTVPAGADEELQDGVPFGSQISYVDAIRHAVKKDTASHVARTIARLEKEAEERETSGA